jgi:hypothetical protein
MPLYFGRQLGHDGHETPNAHEAKQYAE